MNSSRYSAFNDARIVITGGAGFIGSHIAERLVECGARVVIIDDFSSGHRHNIPDGVAEIIEGSILDDNVLADSINGARFVFHEAAMVSVPESVEHPERCMRINVEGTQRVLSASASAGVKRLVFAASAAAYGNEPTLPCTEDAAPDAWSPYAASKIAGEQLLKSFARCTPLSTVSLRYFNVFGPRQDPNSAYAAVISAFADRLLRGEQPTIFGDGKQTRDFVAVANVVDANLLAASCPSDLRGDVFNIGTGQRSSLLDVLRAMAGAVNMPADPILADTRPGDVRDSVADISRARDRLGYKPAVGLEAGLGALMQSKSVKGAS